MIRNQELGNLIKEALIEKENVTPKQMKNFFNLFTEPVTIFLVSIPKLTKAEFKNQKDHID